MACLAVYYSVLKEGYSGNGKFAVNLRGNINDIET